MLFNIAESGNANISVSRTDTEINIEIPEGTPGVAIGFTPKPNNAYNEQWINIDFGDNVVISFDLYSFEGNGPAYVGEYWCSVIVPRKRDFLGMLEEDKFPPVYLYAKLDAMTNIRTEKVEKTAPGRRITK